MDTLKLLLLIAFVIRCKWSGQIVWIVRASIPICLTVLLHLLLLLKQRQCILCWCVLSVFEMNWRQQCRSPNRVLCNMCVFEHVPHNPGQIDRIIKFHPWIDPFQCQMDETCFAKCCPSTNSIHFRLFHSTNARILRVIIFEAVCAFYSIVFIVALVQLKTTWPKCSIFKKFTISTWSAAISYAVHDVHRCNAFESFHLRRLLLSFSFSFFCHFSLSTSVSTLFSSAISRPLFCHIFAIFCSFPNFFVSTEINYL